jgi:hypothetical protein
MSGNAGAAGISVGIKTCTRRKKRTMLGRTRFPNGRIRTERVAPVRSLRYLVIGSQGMFEVWVREREKSDDQQV